MTSVLRSHPAQRRWLVVMLIMLAALASCGGSDESDESSGLVASGPAEVAIPDVAKPTLRAGDCFASKEDLAKSTNKIDCGTPHSFEVFSFEEIAADEFPGSEAVDAQAAEMCEAQFSEVKGAPSAMSLAETLWAVPTDSSWEEGDRYIACAVKYPSDTAQTFTEFNPLRAFGLISIFGFETGDCFAEINLERTGARPISCDSPHGFEVFAVTELPDGDYPGDDVIASTQNSFCGEELETFLGGPTSLGSPQALFPDARTWAELGDRRISCLLATDPMVEGSLRGTGDGRAPSTDGPGTVSTNVVDTDLFGGDLSVGNWISVNEMTSTQIALEWSGVANATSYELSRIDRAAAVGNDPATWSGAESIYTGPDRAHLDTAVVDGVEYVYFITASGADFTTNAQWRAAAAVDDTAAPSPVGSISALRTGDGLLLQWNESSDNYRFAVYEVFRGLNGAEPEYYDTVWQQDKTAFVDAAPPASGEATYQILALDLHGNESERSSLTYSFG